MIDLRVETDDLVGLRAQVVLVQQQLGTRSMAAVDGEVDAMVLHRCSGGVASSG